MLNTVAKNKLGMFLYFPTPHWELDTIPDNLETFTRTSLKQ